jgi:signal transduction histidine kinase/CheY-like chemotaxis protein
MANGSVIEPFGYMFKRHSSILEQRVRERTAELSNALALVEAQKRELESALLARDAIQTQLETELEDAQLLHSISAMLVDEENIGVLYQKLVDVATLIMRSDFGSMQRFDPERGELQLIAHSGLNEEAIAFWHWVHAGRATTCGRALELSERVVVSDFETCDFIAGSEDATAFRRAGVRAAQSTPLLTRNGRLVGMITTHWTHCITPTERDLRLIDIVARQAADLIERNTSAEALRRQADRLVDADRYKDEFLATLAHELRNPLAPIRNGLTLLKIGKPEQAPRILSMMDRQLGHMVHLIDDLLDVSRISRGMITLKPERVELSAVLDSAIETSRPLINAANHKFTVTMPGNIVWLDADVTRVVQIISNLLNNAAKYTPPGGRIDLVAELVDGEAVIRIIDSGIGVPPAMLPKIFDLFTQVDGAAERSQGGLGVGLALSRRLAEMHGGCIEAKSPGEQGGSVFTLRLPTTRPAASDAMADKVHPRLAAPGSSLRVLIVDDNVDAAETLAFVLDQLGHSTSIMVDSRIALAAAVDFQPDVVILDLGMPYLNGFDLARQLRATPSLSHVQLTALSGWGTDEDRAKSRDAGIDHHLTKPVMLAEVVDVLAKAVSRQCI